MVTAVMIKHTGNFTRYDSGMLYDMQLPFGRRLQIGGMRHGRMKHLSNIAPQLVRQNRVKRPNPGGIKGIPAYPYY